MPPVARAPHPCSFHVFLGLALLRLGTGCASAAPPRAELLRTAPATFPFERWDALLKRHVDAEGRVDYAAIDRNEVERLYAAAAASSPKSHPDRYPTAGSKKAYYLDVYNLLVWKGVLDRLPGLRSVGDAKVSFFYTTKYVVGGEKLSLYQLETDVIRPAYHDPRVHMALNCASAGCPRLAAEAFTPDNVEQQLDRDARRFVDEERNVTFDEATGTLKLSSIFDWYRDDFGGSQEALVAWIQRYAPADAPRLAPRHVQFVPYDWRLNDRSLAR